MCCVFNFLLNLMLIPQIIIIIVLKDLILGQSPPIFFQAQKVEQFKEIKDAYF